MFSEIIFKMTYLWGGHITSSPSNKCYGKRGRLFSLAGNVARDEREDQVSFCEIELCAVEGN